MSDNNPDLAAQEVDEELRREQLNTLWKTYGKYIVGGAVGIVLAVAGNEIYTSQVKKGQEANSSAFEAAQVSTATDSADAATVWQDAQPDLSGGYVSLAALRTAQAYAKAGNVDAAITAYDDLANSGEQDIVLVDFAKLMSALLVAEKKADLDDALARLEVIAQKGMPWYYSAYEQIAFINMKQGNSTEAYNKFLRLAGDTQTPQTISARAAQFRDLLEGEQRTSDLTKEALKAPKGETGEE